MKHRAILQFYALAVHGAVIVREAQTMPSHTAERSAEVARAVALLLRLRVADLGLANLCSNERHGNTVKLFIITRQDLPPGAQLAQSVHIAFSHAAEHSDATAAWQQGSNNLVCLAERDEASLEQLAARAQAAGHAVATFHEPDLSDALTAISIYGQGAERLTSCLPLALRAPLSAVA